MVLMLGSTPIARTVIDSERSWTTTIWRVRMIDMSRIGDTMYRDGYRDGYEDGREDGYKEGYDLGLEDGRGDK